MAAALRARGSSASAGTIRNLAAAAQRDLRGPPTLGVQGYVITRDALDALIDRSPSCPPAERARFPGIKSARADLILGGAIVVQTVLEVGGFEAIEVTEAGLREGVFFEHRCSTATRRCSTTCAARAC